MPVAMAKMPGLVTLETAQNKWWTGRVSGGRCVCSLIQVVLMENKYVQNNNTEIENTGFKCSYVQLKYNKYMSR